MPLLLPEQVDLLFLKGVVLQVALLTPSLLFRTRLKEARLAGDRGGDAGQRTGVQVEQEASERGAGSRGRRRSFPVSLGIGCPGRWTVRYPVVDQERNARVR